MIAEIEYEQVLAGISRTLQEVQEERLSQIRKWGDQEHEPHVWLAILAEELGEVAKEVAEAHMGDWKPDRYRAELIQTAAVAAAAIQCLDDGVA